MSLATNVTDLATRIATEIKTLRTLINGNVADLSGLTTTAKTNLVASINELVAEIAAVEESVAQASGVNDTGTSTTSSWSSSKTQSEIQTAVANIIDSAPGTLDTLNEIAAALGDDPNFTTTITTALGNRVRFDAAQTLTGPQQTQARANIGAGTSDLVIGTTGTTAAAGNDPRLSDARTPTSHSHIVTEISNSTTTGRALMTAADAPAARTAIGAGTSNLAIGTTGTTAAAGNDARLSDARTPTAHTHPASQISDSSSVGRSVLTAADAAGARTAIGAGTSNVVIGTTAGTAKSGDYQPTAANISDSTATGRSVLTAANAAGARTAIGAGTSNLVIGTTAGTAADAAEVGSTTTDFVAVFEAGLA